MKEAKIEQSDDRRHKIVFHTLRHTCVSLLTERGADTTAVKNYVAHASEEMTKHCTHLSEEYVRRTAEILNGLCGVISVYGNNLETMAKNEKMAKKTLSWKCLKCLWETGRGEPIWRQVPLEGAQSKRHFVSRSHPLYSDGFTADLAASPYRRHDNEF